MHQSDRRAHRRYPIALEVEYTLLDGQGVRRKGLGRTINISSGGLLLYMNDTLPTLSSIELSVMWPFLPDRSLQLRLIVRGNVVRVATGSIAVEATEQEFHTSGKGRCHQ
ncbi:MAG TPA: PilZ domain-containing protein [Bryobacteraceae bacterium]|nr:PilZ domain-containing protein [Bryobacteraceae bacterium]